MSWTKELVELVEAIDLNEPCEAIKRLDEAGGDTVIGELDAFFTNASIVTR